MNLAQCRVSEMRRTALPACWRGLLRLPCQMKPISLRVNLVVSALASRFERTLSMFKKMAQRQEPSTEALGQVFGVTSWLDATEQEDALSQPKSSGFAASCELSLELFQMCHTRFYVRRRQQLFTGSGTPSLPTIYLETVPRLKFLSRAKHSMMARMFCQSIRRTMALSKVRSLTGNVARP